MKTCDRPPLRHLFLGAIGDGAEHILATFTRKIPRLYPENARTVSGFLSRTGLYFTSAVRHRPGPCPTAPTSFGQKWLAVPTWRRRPCALTIRSGDEGACRRGSLVC